MNSITELFIRPNLRNNESKSQPYYCTSFFLRSCLSGPIYEIMKANHNLKLALMQKNMLFIRPNLRNNESKSQRHLLAASYHLRCLSGPIYEIMKANHNTNHEAMNLPTLFIRPNLRNNESKSQPNQAATDTSNCCLSGPIYEIMKANHNRMVPLLRCILVVYQAQSTK